MKPLLATCFSETGAFSLANLLTKKYGCAIVDKPKLDKDRGMWTFTYTDPISEIVDEIQSPKNERTRRSTRKSKNKRASRSSVR